MAKKDYSELADKIVDLVGGKSNIESFTHCITRLRFNVLSKDAVNVDEIKKLPGAVGAQWQGNQLQVIIGQSVADVYSLICTKNNISGDIVEGKRGTDNGNDKKKFHLSSILDVISGSITPCVPLLMGGGFIKIIVIIGEMLGWLTADMSTYTVLSFAGDAAFYFLPIFIGATTAKKVGANQALGMLMGAILIHPTFLSAISAGESLTIFGLPIYSSAYTSSIFPALLSVWVMAPVEKFFAKHSPNAIRNILEPFCTMLVMIPLSLCILAPLGAIIGTYLSNFIVWLYETLGVLAVALFAGLCPLMVMTGMHAAISSYGLNMLATMGYEPLVLTGMLISNVDQGAACLAVALKSKQESTKSTALGSGITALLGGITEPALFGITLPKKIPLYCAMLGSAVGGAIAGLLKVVGYTVSGSLGLLGGLPVYIPGGAKNVIGICISVAVGFVLTFVLTYVLYKDEA